MSIPTALMSATLLSTSAPRATSAPAPASKDNLLSRACPFGRGVSASKIRKTSCPSRTVLSQDLLERCAQRAGGYDRENRFFMEDFEEVRQTNYLLAAVPQEFAPGLD